jgi:uncharacterized protein YfaS (alpha-2-macroglobulin family)
LPDKSKLYETALRRIETTYPQSLMAAEAAYVRAELLQNSGGLYDPIRHPANQFDWKAAVDICDQIIRQYPKTNPAMQAAELKQNLLQVSFRTEAEAVQIPHEAFRLLLHYRNCPKLYLRIYALDTKDLNDAEQNNSANQREITQKQSFLHAETIELPDAKDFQEHRLEIPIKGLPSGNYAIVLSREPNFKENDNAVGMQLVQVTSLAFLYNQDGNGYVLNRSTGMPINGASIDLYKQDYDNRNSLPARKKIRSLVSDASGRVNIGASDSYQPLFVQLSYQGETLNTDESIYRYYQRNEPAPVSLVTYLFTDRSIYRPGQTVYFKGIAFRKEKEKPSVVTGHQTVLLLKDANQQTIARLTVRSNAFGSFHGQFNLPVAGLTGLYSITDSSNQSSLSFSMEAYKRPKFSVEMEPLKGSFRLNDRISVTGTARAYAGNALNDAQVTYRVTRITQRPFWLYSRWMPDNEAPVEISSGKTKTDNKGVFQIPFTALPDERTDSSQVSYFIYNIKADITDINGETHSSSQTLKVGYQSMLLSIQAPALLPNNRLDSIRIQTLNYNNQFEPATVSVRIHPLAAPNRFFRTRLWEQPDQHLMGETEFHRLFPEDLYADENNPLQWKEQAAIWQKTDSSQADGTFSFSSQVLPAGWYVLIASTVDRYGQPVTSKHYFEAGNTQETTIERPVVSYVTNQRAQPGETAQWTVKTLYDGLYLIRTQTDAVNQQRINETLLDKSKAWVQTIAITEADRGGIGFDYVYIRHNRVYSGNENLPVEWNNKQLTIKLETFRDKLLPGSKETWRLKIEGPSGERVAAEALLNAYDASLDQLKPHSWESLNDIWPRRSLSSRWQSIGFQTAQAYAIVNYPQSSFTLIPKRYDELLFSNRGYANPWGSFAGRASGILVMANAAPAVADENSRNKEKAVFKVKSESGDYAYDSKSNAPNANKPAPEKAIRENLNETAFFLPELRTDSAGNISFEFTLPEALTQWKFMAIAHDAQLASAFTSAYFVTQKPLMVQPNWPRFVREGDRINIVSKIANITNQELTGTAQLELYDAITGKPVDGWFKNVFPNQYFTVAAGQSVAIEFPVEIPYQFDHALGWRIKASTTDQAFSDGEGGLLPVLSNRILVTESMPLFTKSNSNKNYRFEKLLNNNSSSLTQQSLTLELTANPVWLVVQAIPYLAEFPYECAEQSFNRYVANSLGAGLLKQHPSIAQTLAQWQSTNSPALLSNLQKNQELKSTLLQETPWVLEAQQETEQKNRIAQLLNRDKLQSEKQKIFQQITDMQRNDGAFSWFKGGPDNRYITQYIVSGIGHLFQLGVLDASEQAMWKPIVTKGLQYLDQRMQEDYVELKKNKQFRKSNQLQPTILQYLYLRSFFTTEAIPAKYSTAYQFYLAQTKKYGLKLPRPQQAMAALILFRNQSKSAAQALIRSLKENAIVKEEMGMYWKEWNQRGYWWYQAPIENQALMIEAFAEISRDTASVDALKTWLLQQKRTSDWGTTKATAEACYALLVSGQTWIDAQPTVSINAGNWQINSSSSAEAGTGYLRERLPAEKVKPEMGNISIRVEDKQHPNSSLPAWGAVYWQYFEDLDRITGAETPLALQKKIMVERMEANGPVLQSVDDQTDIKVGDKLIVRLVLKADRDMEFVHLKDLRAAGTEPVNVLSGYRWQGGLSYYESTGDAATNFFFDWLPKGTYVFEYPLFVAQAGQFSNGIATIQCMYAPEFSSHSEGSRLSAEANK